MVTEQTSEPARKREEPIAGHLLSKREVLALVPLSYPTIWAMMRKGTFPLSIKLDSTGTKIAWHAGEIQAWILSRERVQLKPLPVPAAPSIGEPSQSAEPASP